MARGVDVEMENILLVIHLLICIALVIVVLLQRSEGGALGMGGGAAGGGMGMFSARGAANTLTRATAFLAIAFICTSLLLAFLAGGERQSESIFDTAPATLPTVTPDQIPEPAPADPAVPTTE